MSGSSARPFSLRIFVADGDPDGLRIAERSNWIGKALIFPRALFTNVRSRDEFNQTGVYLLLGPRDDGEGEKLYVGEGDPVRPRLERHHADKDFWTKALFFVAPTGQLNKAHVQYLEAQLIQRAKQAKRMPLDNSNQPTEPTLSESDRADMLVFLDHMLEMLPVLGIHAFESAKDAAPIAKTNPTLFCSGKGVIAEGHESMQGFVVKANSQAALETAPSMQQHVRSMFDLREKLISIGVLVAEQAFYRFTQDYVFSSPSTAAAVVLGRSANGRIEWKDQAGRVLKSIQAAEVKQVV